MVGFTLLDYFPLVIFFSISKLRSLFWNGNCEVYVMRNFFQVEDLRIWLYCNLDLRYKAKTGPLKCCLTFSQLFSTKRMTRKNSSSLAFLFLLLQIAFNIYASLRSVSNTFSILSFYQFELVWTPTEVAIDCRDWHTSLKTCISL